jgi:predicted transcriptional regulator
MALVPGLPARYKKTASSAALFARGLETSEIAAISPLRLKNVRMWNILWMGLHIMETVQIVLDKNLLRATDYAARLTKRNRSALIRDALREHLRRLRVREAEDRDRAGYAKRPHSRHESLNWEAEAAWPAE